MNKLMYLNVEMRILRLGKTENLQIFEGVYIRIQVLLFGLKSRTRTKSGSYWKANFNSTKGRPLCYLEAQIKCSGSLSQKGFSHKRVYRCWHQGKQLPGALEAQRQRQGKSKPDAIPQVNMLTCWCSVGFEVPVFADTLSKVEVYGFLVYVLPEW